jgi:tol-pal system protein YbgF
LSIKRGQLLLPAALVAGVIVAIPAAALARSPSIDHDAPVQATIIVAQADSAQSASRAEARAMVQLMNQIDALNRDLSQLRGKVEELSNNILNAEKRQKDMYLDLDTRLRRIEATTTDVTSNFKKATGDLSELRARVETLEESAAVSPPVGTMSDNVDVLRAYESAMAKYRAAQYQDAITAFQLIVRQYPNDPLAPNAQYWTGDSFYQLRAYRSAVDAQKELIAKYPNSPKVPDAMLNIGSALIGLEQAPEARQTWEKLIASYPGSRAARNAQERLQRLP